MTPGPCAAAKVNDDVVPVPDGGVAGPTNVSRARSMTATACAPAAVARTYARALSGEIATACGVPDGIASDRTTDADAASTTSAAGPVASSTTTYLPSGVTASATNCVPSESDVCRASDGAATTSIDVPIVCASRT